MTKERYFYKIKIGEIMLDKRGQALTEYILIIALISVIAITLVNLFGGYLKDSITKSGCELAGQEYVEGDKPGEAYCE